MKETFMLKVQQKCLPQRADRSKDERQSEKMAE